jgi:hypothetical protein
MNAKTLVIRGNLYHARLFGNQVSAKESKRMCHEWKLQSMLLSKSWKRNMGTRA